MALKVYGGLTIVHGQQVRTIVAANSQKAAAELAGISLSYLRGYWAVTSNELEMKTAMESPGTVFKSKNSRDTEFTAQLESSGNE